MGGFLIPRHPSCISKTIMARRTSFSRTLCAIALAFAVLSPLARAASDWQVVKVGGWDYLTVDNIANFYGFPPTLEPVNKTIRLDSGANQLEVTLSSREAIVNGVRNWLCFPILQHSDGRFLVSRIDLAKTLEPQFRPQMIGTLRPLKTVVIDPGHGGVEKGAASTYGNEKDFTLDVAKQLKPMLEAQGLRVVMTRDNDAQVPLPRRANIANATRDSIFVSIHFNATDTNAQATGFEIYSLTPRGAPSTQDNSMMAKFANMQVGSPVEAASLALSFSVYHSMLGHMPEFDRGIKRARFAVLRLTQIPAILVEGGFLTERQESRAIASSAWRGRLAKAISTGIQNYRALAEKKQRPMLIADYRRQFEGVLVARDASAPANDDGTASPVYPASNRLAGAAAQITVAKRHEPSPQISLDTDNEKTDESESSPADPTQSAAQQNAVADSAGDADIPGGNSELPAPDAQPAATEPMSVNSPLLDVPTAVKSAAAAIPSAAPKMPTHRTLKFDPPPKFRE
ncbi:MAG: N-acetylmuramoyl-L-alanine amidase [Chthoniobacterales bacterium]|nr:N-acetylmuramoyl-L-alanine amidase [Chthoniobacterales bacterium]